MTSTVYPIDFSSKKHLRVPLKMSEDKGKDDLVSALVQTIHAKYKEKFPNLSRRQFIGTSAAGLALVAVGAFWLINKNSKKGDLETEIISLHIKIGQSNDQQEITEYVEKLLSFDSIEALRANGWIMQEQIFSRSGLNMSSLDDLLGFEWDELDGKFAKVRKYKKDNTYLLGPTRMPYSLDKVLEVIAKTENEEKRNSYISNLVKSYKEGMDLARKDITFGRFSLFLSTRGLIAFSLIVSTRIEDREKRMLFDIVQDLFPVLLQKGRVSESVRKTLKIYLFDFFKFETPEKIELIKYLVQLCKSFGNVESYWFLTQQLTTIYNKEVDEEVKSTILKQLQDLGDTSMRGEGPQELQEPLVIIENGFRKNYFEIVGKDRVFAQSTLGALNILYRGREDPYESSSGIGYLKIYLLEGYNLASCMLEMEVEGPKEKDKRIQKIAITYGGEVHEVEDGIVHTDDIDVSKDGIIRISIPMMTMLKQEQSTFIDMSRIATILIHFGTVYDTESKRRVRILNKQNTTISIKNLRIVPRKMSSRLPLEFGVLKSIRQGN